YGQGFLDSVLGPSGFGLWGGGQFEQQTTQQFNSPQFYQGQMNPEQAGQYPQAQMQQAPVQYGQPQMPGAYPQQGAPQVQYYSNQPGAEAGWQAQQPMMQQPSAQPYQAPPPVRYAPQQPLQAQSPPPGAPVQPPLRPGQYSPQQGPPGAMDIDQLPPGAVSITTITPEGTTVQYYPPAGEAPPPVQQPVRRVAPQQKKKPSATERAKPAQEQTVAGPRSDESGAVAMPKPVQVPQGRDPRSGWDHAVNRAPRAPEVR
ncbi:MAG: hypothetical protein LDL33_09285, partial [Desulfomonile sp.]|nr:hypothetical protein [Desulfomonile sp.]